MQSDSAGRGDLLQHGQPAQLVTEAHHGRTGEQHTRSQTPVEVLRIGSGERFEKPVLTTQRNHGDGVQDRAGRVIEPSHPSQYGVADAHGELLRGGSQHFGDEERVAAGPTVQTLHVRKVGSRDRGDPGQRQGGQEDPTHRLAGRQLADDNPQWMGRGELVVPVRRDHQGGDAVQAARQDAHDVEGGLVRPMDVFEDQDRRRPTQLRSQGVRQLVRPHPLLGQLGEGTSGQSRDVQKRPERTRA